MTITGIAAGVPFTALPPTGEQKAPLIVTWHLMDAPCTDAAFAAALPLNEVPAWRVHLGMPMCGARMVDGGLDAAIELARRDPMLAYVDAFVRQAADEFPAALVALRKRFPIDEGPIGIVGGSLGGAVALRVLAEPPVPIAAAALVNPAVRARSVVGVVEENTGTRYTWTDEASAAADALDFVARADEITAPVLVVSGEQDIPVFRQDAAALVDALGEARLITVPGLEHPLAERPGLEPAPQLPVATIVDKAITEWFVRSLTGSAAQEPGEDPVGDGRRLKVRVVADSV
jgi:pimeloyl-ACP methyl ester carboxylesterase